MFTTAEHNRQRPYDHLLAAIAAGSNIGMFELADDATDATPYVWRLLGDVVEIRPVWDHNWQLVRNPLAVAAQVSGKPMDWSMPAAIYDQAEQLMVQP